MSPSGQKSPAGLIDGIRALHENNQLNNHDVIDLATRIAAVATHLDRHGHLPEQWMEPALVQPTVQPGTVEIGC